MSNQAVESIDHVGLAARAHFDLRYHLPDERQVDLGDTHPAVVPPGERESHIRLRILPKIDRAIVTFVRYGMAKLGLTGAIDSAPEHVRVCPRNAKLLKTRRVDLFKLGNCRHLAKQAPGVDPALFKRARVPRQLNGPAELRLDPVDELADLGRGHFGLLALNADERSPMLSVEEPDLRRPVDKQRHRDQRHEQRDVFHEQAVASSRKRHRSRRRKVSHRCKYPRRGAFEKCKRGLLRHPIGSFTRLLRTSHTLPYKTATHRLLVSFTEPLRSILKSNSA